MLRLSVQGRRLTPQRGPRAGFGFYFEMSMEKQRHDAEHLHISDIPYVRSSHVYHFSMIDLRNLSILAGWPEGSTFLWLGLVFSLLLFLNFLRKSISPASSSSSDTDSGVVRASYPPIEPLQDFDWRTKEPVKIRPFKPKYHLTMSMSTVPADRNAASDARRYPRCNSQRTH